MVINLLQVLLYQEPMEEGGRVAFMLVLEVVVQQLFSMKKKLLQQEVVEVLYI